MGDILRLVTPFMTNRKSLKILKMQELIGFWRASKDDISSYYDHPLPGPSINSVYSSTLGPSYFAMKLRHFTSYIRALISRCQRRPNGWQNTWQGASTQLTSAFPDLGKSITWSCGANLLPQWPGWNPIFLSNPKYLKLALKIIMQFSEKEALSCRYLFTLTLLLCHSRHPTITSLTMWLSKTIDAPICQRANKFPSSASRTKSTFCREKHVKLLLGWVDKKEVLKMILKFLVQG